MQRMQRNNPNEPPTTHVPNDRTHSVVAAGDLGGFAYQGEVAAVGSHAC